jgi:hypothetical protein
MRAGLLACVRAWRLLNATQLCYGRVRKTVASLEMSEGPVPGLREAGAGVSVVDMPGHVRLRHDMLAKCGPRALGVVFVVDSAAMKKSPGDVAEYLYELLSAPALRGVPFLMLCNKQDLTWLALKPALVVSKLEGEFDTIRDSRRAALADVSTVKGSRSAADAAHPVILGVDVRCCGGSSSLFLSISFLLAFPIIFVTL